MVTAPVIVAEGLSKLYRIGLREQRRETLAGTILDVVRSPAANFRKLRALSDLTESNADDVDVIWALRDASFEVAEGEVLGVIGVNGAGKSTLLQVLTGITEPTAGRAEIRGRVASLLQVGTGFHPELTGRENVYLNGTILGMTKAEVEESFDEIVAFSGVERFIDTPVKRYSSGMTVRLGFAVAAHLKPEIMLIDEVLAVGDLSFQQKCLGKMNEVARGGRTVLFVSHNMAAVESLCDVTMVLEGGRIVFHGDTREAIQRYVSETSVLDPDIDLTDHPDRITDTRALRRLTLRNCEDVETATFSMGSDIEFRIEVDAGGRLPRARLGIGIGNLMGQRLCTFDTGVQYPAELELDGRVAVTCRWDRCPLLPGEYVVTVWVRSAGELVDAFQNVGRLSIAAADVHGTGRVQSMPGVFEPRATWEVDPADRGGLELVR